MSQKLTGKELRSLWHSGWDAGRDHLEAADVAWDRLAEQVVLEDPASRLSREAREREKDDQR